MSTLTAYDYDESTQPGQTVHITRQIAVTYRGTRETYEIATGPHDSTAWNNVTRDYWGRGRVTTGRDDNLAVQVEMVDGPDA